MLAAAILVVNINLPHVIETLCSVAIVWVNLAYLLVTLPMLVARLRRRWQAGSPRSDRAAGRLFSMGRLGLPVNAIAVAWGVFVVINIGWPRPEIYGPDPWGRFAAPLATLALLAAGGLYYAPCSADGSGHHVGARAGITRRWAACRRRPAGRGPLDRPPRGQ